MTSGCALSAEDSCNATIVAPSLGLTNLPVGMSPAI
jgi:hypothetical protein